MTLMRESIFFHIYVHMQQKDEFVVMPKVRGHSKAVACKTH